ncbi:hypothetical protein ISF_09764 [Cordyceps fumosorosea ARSEF 2679]|uniref:Uncharacterized protein n=1 Tax=Cordyceps fumosorosea (strain ARSEF 2679) TaxID=1081104 RepID=A0A167D1E7_CORFA|nr:hypothetical protein ISF_09764 [Cordyceps fumosorosea ARSEF 2679]OAA41836.1 hypothetical protein ISF_09764 [Cordyceps fumosorosea ARSEF 2679]
MRVHRTRVWPGTRYRVPNPAGKLVQAGASWCKLVQGDTEVLVRSTNFTDRRRLDGAGKYKKTPDNRQEVGGDGHTDDQNRIPFLVADRMQHLPQPATPAHKDSVSMLRDIMPLTKEVLEKTTIKPDSKEWGETYDRIEARKEQAEAIVSLPEPTQLALINSASKSRRNRNLSAAKLLQEQVNVVGMEGVLTEQRWIRTWHTQRDVADIAKGNNGTKSKRQEGK